MHRTPFHLCLRYQVPIISVFQVIKIVANYMFSWASKALTLSIMSSECKLKNEISFVEKGSPSREYDYVEWLTPHLKLLQNY